MKEPVIEDQETLGADAVEERPAGGPSGRGEGRLALELGVLTVAVVVLALAVLGWTRARGHDDEAVARGDLRDAVLITARSHIETMNTLDHRDIEGGLARWENVSTGTLKDQISATTEETRQLMEDQKKVSTGKVVDAAVVDLTEDTATVIAAVEVTVVDDSDPSAEPTVKRNRFAADLVKVGDDWLLEALDQVAVDLS